MAKKKTPEQETGPVTEEQNTEETGAEETEETQEETSEQEQEPEDQEESEEEESAAGEEEEDPQDQQPEDQPGDAPAQEQPADDETARLRSDLLQAQGKLAAYAAGVALGMVDDAVTLAMAEAAKAGEVTEAALTKAMEAVLKRHPEWKAAGTDKPKGGFKLGADRDSGSAFRKQSSNATQNVKRWNRFK